MLDFWHGAVRYTLIIINDRYAAYEATPNIHVHDKGAEIPVPNVYEAAEAAFNGSDPDLDVSDKSFIYRWQELVGARDSSPKPRPEEDDPDDGPSVVRYGPLKGI